MSGNILILGRHIGSRGNELSERLAVERKRFDGRVQSPVRDTYDPADGAAIWRYEPSRSRAVLVRQYRLAAFFETQP